MAKKHLMVIILVLIGIKIILYFITYSLTNITTIPLSIDVKNFIAVYSPFIITTIFTIILTKSFNINKSIKSFSVEELLFRKLLFRNLKKISSLKISILLSSILFTIHHFDFYYFELNQFLVSRFLPLLLVGILLAYIYHITESLLLTILCHSIMNILIVFTKIKETEFEANMFLIHLVIFITSYFLVYLSLKKLKQFKDSEN